MITKSQIKYIQSLSEKKFRKEGDCFVAEGPKIINEFLINNDPELLSIYATDQWAEKARASGLRHHISKLSIISESDLKSISFLSTPNQVLGIFQQKALELPLFFQHKLSLILDGIQDPGNFGTIVRIADWYDIEYIIAGNDCADVYSPKVVQSTMGSVARVKVVYEDLPSFIDSNKNIPLYASTLNGRPFSSFGRVEEGFLVIGNESKGIADGLIAAASHQVTIPNFGKAESLNAAVAAGILLSGFRGFS